MEIRKLKALVFVLIATFTFASYTFGQAPEKGHHRGMKDASFLKEKLDLTDEQAASLENINTDFKAKYKAVKNTEGENKWEAFRALKKEHMAAVTEILTPEQAAKLRALKSEKYGERKEHRKAFREHHKESKKEFKAKIKPLMKAQRKQLDSDISRKDKKEIDRLRKVANDIRMACKAEKAACSEGKKDGKPGARSEHHRKHFGKKHRMFNKMKTEFPEDYKSLGSLTEKYASQIKTLQDEIQPQMDALKNEREERHRKHIDEMDIPDEKKAVIRKKMAKKKERFAQKNKADFEEHKAMIFLLLDPNKDAENEISTNKRSRFSDDIQQGISVFPNPGFDIQTIEFAVKKSGNVKIDIIDKSGKIVQSVFDHFMEAGNHSLKVNVSKLNNGIYYYTIVDESGKTSSRFMITK